MNRVQADGKRRALEVFNRSDQGIFIHQARLFQTSVLAVGRLIVFSMKERRHSHRSEDIVMIFVQSRVGKAQLENRHPEGASVLTSEKPAKLPPKVVLDGGDQPTEGGQQKKLTKPSPWRKRHGLAVLNKRQCPRKSESTLRNCRLGNKKTGT